jgi:hypothetical protein
MLYFLSRGDEPIFPYTRLVRGLLLRNEPQAYIVRKPATGPVTTSDTAALERIRANGPNGPIDTGTIL